MLPARNTLRTAAPVAGWDLESGHTCRSPRRGRKCTGNNNQWSCCIGVWRAVPAPPCCPTYFDRTPLRNLPLRANPSRSCLLCLAPFIVLRQLLHPPSYSFTDIDEPPCALLPSTWTPPTEGLQDVASCIYICILGLRSSLRHLFGEERYSFLVVIFSCKINIVWNYFSSVLIEFLFVCKEMI